MYPILFRVGDFTVTSYGVLLVLAFIGAGLVVASEWRRRGWDAGDAQDIVLAAMIGGIGGSKLYWAIAQGDEFLADPIGTIFTRGGFTYWGGLIGGIVCVTLWLKWRGYPLRAAVDSCALAIPIGYMLGRTGCFLVGDDYGKPTDLPWGIAFPEGSPPTQVPVHPTQLYEIGMTLPIFVLLWLQRDRGYPDGFLFFEFMVLAGIERFVVEFWRVNAKVALGLTAAQWIGIGFVLVGAAGIVWVRRNPVHTPARSEAPART